LDTEAAKLVSKNQYQSLISGCANRSAAVTKEKGRSPRKNLAVIKERHRRADVGEEKSAERWAVTDAHFDGQHDGTARQPVLQQGVR